MKTTTEKKLLQAANLAPLGRLDRKGCRSTPYETNIYYEYCANSSTGFYGNINVRNRISI